MLNHENSVKLSYQFLFSFGADINYCTIHGESAMSVAHRYKRHNVIARLSVTLNTKLVGLSRDIHTQNNRLYPKAVIHYESESATTNKRRIICNKLKVKEKLIIIDLVGQKRCYYNTNNVS